MFLHVLVLAALLVAAQAQFKQISATALDGTM
jgi:hypothetical protein